MLMTSAIKGRQTDFFSPFQKIGPERQVTDFADGMMKLSSFGKAQINKTSISNSFRINLFSQHTHPTKKRNGV